jgi:GxxExxY protein
MEEEKSKLLHPALTEKIIGVYYDVYNEIGHGFLETVYRNAMQIALTEAGLLVQREFPIPVWFRGQEVGQFRADLLVEKVVLLELKAVSALDRSHEAQILHYLRATEIEIGLLFNFGSLRPQFRRLVFENTNKKICVHPRESAVRGSAAGGLSEQ